MSPKASDQKRKRGRPPGASKLKPDASSHEAPENDPEPDVEERVRPRKRGRKNDTEDSNTKSDHAPNENGPARSSRVGRPPKKSQHTATEDVKPEIEERDSRANIDKNAASKSNSSPSSGRRRAAPRGEPPAEQPESSERRRIGRARGTRTSAEVSEVSEPPTSLPDKLKEREPRRAGPASSGASEEARQPDRVSSRRRQNKKHEAQPEMAKDDTDSTTRAGPPRQAAASKAQQNEPAVEAGKKRRGRPSLNKEGSESVRALQPQQGNRTKAPKKSSKAGQAVDGSESIEEPSHPKRRGRPRKSDTSPPEPEPARPSRSRGRSRRLSPEPADEHEQQKEQAPAKNKRKQQPPRQMESVVEEEEEGGASSELDEEEPPFRFLRESTKNIPRSVISEKWNALDGPSISAVGTFLADAQRPVLLRLQDTNRRREHASAALLGVSRRLHTKLVKGLPFPAPTAGPVRRAASGSYEDEFDFERTMNAVQSLENTLNPLLHSVSLLEREIKKEEDALAKDYDSLHKLEANARSEAKGWREKAKREHVLAPGIMRKSDSGDYDGSGDRLELVAKPDEVALNGLFKDLDDEELMTLSKQIGSHMDSMQGNLQQIGGIVPAISRSKAALQQVVLKHLDEDQYDKLLLG
ncbi:hypothetical protein Daus18300_007545 [Diaporthe australafricana]|uniref:Kinetochore protein fta7 n=1 Tax=Diaporthe australafricana TaxID=127596 RepID=A0ABR3WMK7_9PEZI